MQITGFSADNDVTAGKPPKIVDSTYVQLNGTDVTPCHASSVNMSIAFTSDPGHVLAHAKLPTNSSGAFVFHAFIGKIEQGVSLTATVIDTVTSDKATVQTTVAGGDF